MLNAVNNTCVATRILIFIQFVLYLGISICSAKVLVENVCYTEECQKAAVEISKSMDRDVSPCDNFYQFVCGKFAEDTKLSDKLDSISIIDKMEDSIPSLIAHYLDTNSYLHTNEPFKEAFKFYELCKNRDAVSGQEVSDLAEMIEEIGGWPIVEGARWKKQRWEVIAGRLSKLGASSDILFDVQIEAGTSGENFTILLNAKQFNEFSPTSWERLRKIAVEMRADDTTEIEELSDTSAVNLLKHLKHRPTENDHYDYLTIQDMMTMWPSINWMMYFTGVFSVWPVININENQRVHANLNYINDVVDAIGKTEESEIMNYVIADFIEGYLEFLHYELSEDSNSTLGQQTISSTSEKRKINCALFIARSVPEMIDAMFLVNHVTDQQRSEITEMFDSLKTKMRALLEQAHWLEISARRNFMEKLSNLTLDIGYEAAIKNNEYFDKYEDLYLDGRNFLRSALSFARFKKMNNLKKSIDPTSFVGISPLLMTTFVASPMTTPKARYMSDANKIVVLPGLLQDPYINEKLPKYIDYGGVGFAIAHELAHAFSHMMESMYQYESTTSSIEMSNLLVDRIDCFRNQGISYYMKELNLTIDGFWALAEDIADNIGVQLAYSIYEDWMSQNQPVSTLSHLNYTPLQMFWISYSRNKCVKYNPKYLKDTRENDSYSFEEYITNGVLVNHPAFSEAFGCQSGSIMNPVEKCAIW